MQSALTTAATEWISVMEDASLPEGSMQPAYPRGLNLVMARIDGKVYAVAGACAHMGCPLFTGSLTAGILTCPCHDWRYDVRTGEFLDAPEIRLAVYPVRSENGKLLINLG
jgi:nitrite reductase/ring-hydroxylating ferredoxin subunit